MPASGMLWRHVVINTKNTWQHGDRRGFRSRKHRIHSSGDYKSPPPKGEHAGLLRYRLERTGEPVSLAEELRAVVGQCIAEELSNNYRLLAVAVDEIHTHIIAEFPWQLREVKRIIGDAKRNSSRAIKDVLPGSVWAYGGTFKIIKDRSHMRNCYPYVLYDQGAEAWTWSHEDGSLDGTFGRARPE